MENTGYIYLLEMDSSIPYNFNGIEKDRPGEIIVIKDLTIEKYENIFDDEFVKSIAKIIEQEEPEHYYYYFMTLGEFEYFEKEITKKRVLTFLKDYILNNQQKSNMIEFAQKLSLIISNSLNTKLAVCFDFEKCEFGQ